MPEQRSVDRRDFLKSAAPTGAAALAPVANAAQLQVRHARGNHAITCRPGRWAQTGTHRDDVVAAAEGEYLQAGTAQP